MDSITYIDNVKDEASMISKEDDKENWCVKEEDALKAIDMAKKEAEEEIEDNTLYSIKKGDFVNIYNVEEDRYVVGKLDRITKSAFYFTATNNEETIYSRDKWSIKIEI